MDPSFDPYKVLQVDPEAEDEVLEAAYRRLARKYHPDLTTDPEAPARMIALNRAWELLGTTAGRAAHDRQRASRGPAASSPPGAGRPADQRPSTPDLATIIREEAARADQPRPPDTVSRDWTSGRSGTGSGYDPATMRAAEGTGAAGPPPGNPSGTVLRFGRYAGWSMGEIARADIEYLEWLDRMPIGRPYRDEIDQLLRRAGRRRSAAAEADERRGLFRRR